MALLDIHDLRVYYETRHGAVKAVDGVGFSMEQGEHLGLIGESGCGKTTVGRAIIRVLPRNARIVEGEISFQGQDLLKLREREMRHIRWREIAMIPQSSMDALDPVYRVGDQIVEVLVERGGYDRRAAWERAHELFQLVGLDPSRLRYYPHEFSGGMKQRAVIAMSLALEPALIIADEPVTALDVIVQHQVLQRFRELQHELSLSVLMITHDMSVVAQTCDSVIVMYAGKMMEWGSVDQIFYHPFHPYTLGLKQAFPNLAQPRDELISIEGYLPDLIHPPPGCRFADRCPFALPDCREAEPELIEVEEGHQVACHRTDDVEELRARAQEVETWQTLA
ncbi:MAG TPA: ABC transporter ATP-binding protein [Caldilineae bacterium]|jgi:peptide/nickel transport system ATP-binding protein|nr:ABC transporter ATP-binding protein [Caldilineae bacterium]